MLFLWELHGLTRGKCSGTFCPGKTGCFLKCFPLVDKLSHSKMFRNYLFSDWWVTITTCPRSLLMPSHLGIVLPLQRCHKVQEIQSNSVFLPSWLGCQEHLQLVTVWTTNCCSRRAVCKLTSMKGKTRPTVKLHSQWMEPPTMKAEGRADCLNISVVTTLGMGPEEHTARLTTTKTITVNHHSLSVTAHVSNNWVLIYRKTWLHVWAHPNNIQDFSVLECV